MSVRSFHVLHIPQAPFAEGVPMFLLNTALARDFSSWSPRSARCAARLTGARLAPAASHRASVARNVLAGSKASVLVVREAAANQDRTG